MTAIMETANQNTEVLRTLKLHIGMGLEGEKSDDNSLDLQVRIAEIDAEFRKMLDRVSTETVEAFDEETATRLMNEKSRLQQKLDNIADAEQRRENAKSRLNEIYTILDGLQNHPMEYDDKLVRQIIECVVVESKEKIKVDEVTEHTLLVAVLWCSPLSLACQLLYLLKGLSVNDRLVSVLEDCPILFAIGNTGFVLK